MMIAAAIPDCLYTDYCRIAKIDSTSDKGVLDEGRRRYSGRPRGCGIFSLYPHEQSASSLGGTCERLQLSKTPLSPWIRILKRSTRVDRVFGVHFAGGHRARKIFGLVRADARGTPSIQAESAQNAFITGPLLNACRACAGRYILIGTYIDLLRPTGPIMKMRIDDGPKIL